MSKQDQSVFPQEGELRQYPDRDGVYWTGSPGLTKRELFAAMAMQGNAANPELIGWKGPEFAELAVEMADALLAALAKEQA